MSDPVQYLVVGGGLAGAATAFRLVEAGAEGVVVLEREVLPGVHASGRNAAMIRHVVPDETTAALSREGADFIEHIARAWDPPVGLRRTGSFFLGAGVALERLEDAAEVAAGHGVAVELLSASRIRSRMPILEAARFEGGVFCPSDGVVDVAALLHGFLARARAGGAVLCFGEGVEEIERADGRIVGVRTNRRWLRPGVVVNAAGCWAGVLGRMAGATPVPTRALRRHLYCTAPVAWADPDWPYVWDEAAGYYIRPESGGFLLCACDEDLQPPGLPAVDPSVAEMLADKMSAHIPVVADLPLARQWAGLRTFAPDRRFVVGFDPVVENLFWVSHLGGHGVTTSAAVGRRAAERLLAGRSGHADPLSPARFAGLSVGRIGG